MWHYQVTRKEVEGGFVCEIREVYHDMLNENNLGVCWTEYPISAIGQTKEDVIKELEMMLEDAKNNPILDITDERDPKLVVD